VKTSRIIVSVFLLFAVAFIAWQVFTKLESSQNIKKSKKNTDRPIPVLTAAVTTGPISLNINFTGTLEPSAEFLASPKVGGVLQNLNFDLGDNVSRGQTVAILDSAEFDQAVIQAEADQEVAKANLQEARSLLKITERELKRIDKLGVRGVSSASQRDLVEADQLAKQAHVKVTIAELSRASAQLETARIRRGYTKVSADWHGNDTPRLVAERFVDQGETINANTPLLKIVKIDPITAVFYVTEKEYSGLLKGQPVSLNTDAYPEKQFSGMIERISPVFKEQSRQARIEVQVDNPELLLKPGMFVRSNVILREKQKATIIPRQGLTHRDEKQGVFLLSDDGKTVTWQTVKTGIHQDEIIEIISPELHGYIVTLGQQLLKDGSSVIQPSKNKNQ